MNSNKKNEAGSKLDNTIWRVITWIAIIVSFSISAWIIIPSQTQFRVELEEIKSVPICDIRQQLDIKYKLVNTGSKTISEKDVFIDLFFDNKHVARATDLRAVKAGASFDGSLAVPKTALSSGTKPFTLLARRKSSLFMKQGYMQRYHEIDSQIINLTNTNNDEQ